MEIIYIGRKKTKPVLVQNPCNYKIVPGTVNVETALKFVSSQFNMSFASLRLTFNSVAVPQLTIYDLVLLLWTHEIPYL